MMPVSEVIEINVKKAFSSTSRCLDDLSNKDNKYFNGLISQIYSSELN